MTYSITKLQHPSNAFNIIIIIIIIIITMAKMAYNQVVIPDQ